MASRRDQSLQSEPNFAADPFERLPRDILLPLVKLTSDFATLWSLSIVSRAVHQVIDDFGKEIFEKAMHASELEQIWFFFRPIALLKLRIHPSTSLKEFKQRHVGSWISVRNHLNKSSSLNDVPIVDRWNIVRSRLALLPENTPPSVIHKLLRTSYNISVSSTFH